MYHFLNRLDLILKVCGGLLGPEAFVLTLLVYTGHVVVAFRDPHVVSHTLVHERARSCSVR